jgi:hypothetical protein
MVSCLDVLWCRAYPNHRRQGGIARLWTHSPSHSALPHALRRFDRTAMAYNDPVYQARLIKRAELLAASPKRGVSSRQLQGEHNL